MSLPTFVEKINGMSLIFGKLFTKSFGSGDAVKKLMDKTVINIIAIIFFCILNFIFPFRSIRRRVAGSRTFIVHRVLILF